MYALVWVGLREAINTGKQRSHFHLQACMSSSWVKSATIGGILFVTESLVACMISCIGYLARSCALTDFSDAGWALNSGIFYQSQ